MLAGELGCRRLVVATVFLALRLIERSLEPRNRVDG